ncbi:myeloid leukemia factor 1 isoform X2 [Senna tora]|uniref:Myeloid leukemia factor 1 isoform X2 n=1 Tax=Senna tora TaxID=362788 RepID=A0A834TSB1_9FABA|nr:myeloid leukemia factor 1 isoform X2 [Senna tora]
MQKGREGSGHIFESRNGFRGFEDFSVFGSHRSMIPSLFGGRDPFDDPFFTSPFDNMFGPTSAPRNMQKMSTEKGIIIKELDSDDEGGIYYSETGDKEQNKSRSTMEPTVEHPDDDDNAVGKNKNVTYRNDRNKVEPSKPVNFSFRTCKVTYGGVDGAYYTSTKTRKMGADGVVLEESKEADKTTGEATHRITRGIHDKGHSFTRKLNSDGKVDTMLTLHNLDEDELSRFEKEWEGNNTRKFPGWKGGYGMHRNESFGNNEPREKHMLRSWSVTSLEQGGRAGGYVNSNEGNSSGRAKKVVRINIE